MALEDLGLVYVEEPAETMYMWERTRMLDSRAHKVDTVVFTTLDGYLYT